MLLTFLFAAIKYLKRRNVKAGRFILASGGEGMLASMVGGGSLW